jgi:hypothetical protein
MEPIRRLGPYEPNVTAVTKVGDAHVRRETPEEAHERRQREQRDRARKQAARAWADAQLKRVQEQPILPDDESEDGTPHVDIRV